MMRAGFVYDHLLRSYVQREAEMPQASKKRRRQVHDLAEENLATAPANLTQPLLRQVHHLSAVSLETGKPPRLGRTAQENEYADWLIETMSASLHQRTMPKKEMISRGTRQFGLSERRTFVNRLSISSMQKAGQVLGRREASVGALADLVRFENRADYSC